MCPMHPWSAPQFVLGTDQYKQFGHLVSAMKPTVLENQLKKDALNHI